MYWVSGQADKILGLSRTKSFGVLYCPVRRQGGLPQDIGVAGTFATLPRGRDCELFHKMGGVATGSKMSRVERRRGPVCTAFELNRVDSEPLGRRGISRGRRREGAVGRLPMLRACVRSAFL